MARLWPYLARHWGLVLTAVVLSIGSNLFALIGPLLSGYAIDGMELGTGQVDFDTVFHYAWLMLLFYLTSSVMSYILSMVMLTLSQRVVFSLRKDVFDRLMEMPVSFFDRNATGDIISRISYDIDTVNASLTNDLIAIITTVFTVVGSAVMMLAISPLLSLVFVVTVPISIFFARYRSQKVRPLFSKRSRMLGMLNGFVEQTVSGQKTVKAYHREEAFVARFDERNDEACEAYYKADYYGSSIGPSMNFINNLSLSLISMLGAVLYLLNKLSLGDISSFVLYSRKFSGPINEIANILAELQSAFSAAERVFNLIDQPLEPADDPDAEVLTDVKGHVEVRDVSFGYDPERIILHDFNVDVKPGSLIAVVGPTGAGKTTLINLLMRFYDVNSGSICIDGKDIRHVTRDSLRRAYTMVLQDTWLFHGTVRDNLAYGRPDATEEEIVAAAKAAHIHDYIMHLSREYDTIITDNGANISKGQKQLMTIARAMLVNSPMLILDEATSNVDTQTEAVIQDAMQKLMRGRTCFVIAHRLSTIRNADHILVVNEGNIVEQGTHDTLLEKGGVYAALYRSQFETY